MATVHSVSNPAPQPTSDQDISQVKNFLQGVIQNKIASYNARSNNHTPEYILIVNQIYKKDDPETLYAILMSLKSFTNHLTSRPETFRELLTAIFSYDWKADLKTNLAALDLIANLVFTNAVFLISAFELFAHSFVSLKSNIQSVSLLDSAENTTAPTFDEEYKVHIHETIKKIITSVPMGQSKLFPVLRRSFPHKRFSKQILVEYTSNMLQVCHYLPLSQYNILDLVVTRCLELDVEIVIEDSGEVRLQRDATQGDDDDDDGFILHRAKDENNIIQQLNSKDHDQDDDDLIFGFEDDITTTSTNIHSHSHSHSSSNRIVLSNTKATLAGASAGAGSVHKPRIADEVSESAEKLDDLLITLIDFFESILSNNTNNTSNNSGQQDSQNNRRSEQQQRLFHHLLRIFEQRLVTAHKSKFVQFILFYVASRDHCFAELLAKRMLEIVQDSAEASINRQSAVMYLASYLSRATFLGIHIVRNILAELVKWAVHYVLLHHAHTTALTADQAQQLSVSHGQQHVKGNGQVTHAMHSMHLQGTKHSNGNNRAFVHTIEFDEYGRLQVVEHTAAHHELFYAVMQSACYVLCFHGLDCMQALIQPDTNNTNGAGFDMGLAWEVILSSKFEPLKYCLQSVSSEFVKLASAVRLCPTIVAMTGGGVEGEEGKQQRSNSTSSISASVAASVTSSKLTSLTCSSNTTASSGMTALGPFSLDSFFPFDPCLLRRLHSCIETGYRSWRGVPGIDDDLHATSAYYSHGAAGQLEDEDIDDDEYYTEDEDDYDDDIAGDNDQDHDEQDQEIEDEHGLPMAMSLASSYAKSAAMSLASERHQSASYHNSNHFQNNPLSNSANGHTSSNNNNNTASNNNFQYNSYTSKQQDYSYMRSLRNNSHSDDDEQDDHDIILNNEDGVQHIITANQQANNARRVIGLDQLSSYGIGLPGSNYENNQTNPRERRPRFNSIGSSTGW